LVAADEVVAARSTGGAVIEQLAQRSEAGVTSLLIRPNRALNSGQLLFAFALVATASGLVAGFSWLQGNVFAPLFACLELSALALCLRLVWLAGERAEILAVGPLEVSLRGLPDLRDRFRAHPQWVRLQQSEGRVLLVSRGHAVEVGACLGEDERASLAGRIRLMMGAVIADRDAGTAVTP